MNQQLDLNDPHLDERRGCTSASNAEADSLCQGRFQAQKGKTSVETDDAKHGQKIHEALRTGDTSGLTHEQRDIYDSCIQIETKIIAQLFPELAEGNAKPKLWRETRKFCIVPPANREHSAKPDVVYRLAQRALIIEYKTLAGEVPDSPYNLQLRDQAVLVRGDLLVSDIAVVVIQPLVTHTPEICFYSTDDLKRAEAEMFARVNASHDPNAKRTAGDVQCKFCLAKNDCMEYQKWAGSSVPGMLSLLDVPTSAWTPEQKLQFLDRASIAQKWLDETKESIKAELKENPSAIPGYGLKEGNKRESITDPQAVYDRFSAAGGSAEQFLKTVTVKKGELKEQLAAVTGNKGKSLELDLRKLLDGLVEIKQNEPSIVKVERKATEIEV